MKYKKLIQMLWFGAAILLFAGVLMLYSMFTFYSGASSADGKVSEIKESIVNGARLYYPVIDFEAKNGEKYQFTPKMGSGSKQYKVGQTIPILYNPENPTIARLDVGIDTWIYGSFLMGAGFFCLALSFFLMFTEKRNEALKL